MSEGANKPEGEKEKYTFFDQDTIQGSNSGIL